MKSFQDLYTEIIQSDELKKAFVDAVKADRVLDFLKEQGCDVTPEEVREFLEEKAAENDPLELSAERLREVAGGDGDNTVLTYPICSASDTCACSNTCIRDCC